MQQCKPTLPSQVLGLSKKLVFSRRAKKVRCSFHQDPYVSNMKCPVRGFLVNPQVQEARYAFEISIVSLLKDCTRQRDLYRGIRLHADALRKGLLQNNVYIGSALVNMYVKCGKITNAQQVFDEIRIRDLITWNSLIAGYAQHECCEVALDFYQQMQDEGLSPNPVTFSCILKACGKMGALQKGEEIHAKIAEKKLFKKNSVLGTTLVDMYAKCGELKKAQQVFEDLHFQDMVSWNVLIQGYAQHGYGDKAFECYSQMKTAGFTPNSVTFLGVLQACGILKAVEKGVDIHSEIARVGLLGKDVLLGTALVNMYAKCGALLMAREVFNNLPVRDAVSWNALLSGYFQHGYGKEALRCFEEMQQEGFYSNSVTLLCALQACASVGGGTQIHAEIARKGLLKEDTVLGNALVHMYANCGAFSKAQEVLDELLNWDRVAVTALIAGYCQNEDGEKALRCYEEMQRKGLSPDAVTYTCILQACGSIGAVEVGKEVHAEIVGQDLLGKDCALGSALVDMYAKCGAVAKAQEVFDKLPVRNVCCWTAIITAFAKTGRHEIVSQLFNQMVGEGIKPNVVTFVVLLYACGSFGLVNKGLSYYENMCATYGIVPSLDHCRCMIDLYGRSGHFDNAIALLNKVPSSDYLPVWLALLDACQKWRNMKLGQFAFEHALQLDSR